MQFADKLNAIIKKNNSLVCVGLDPDFEKLPEFLKSELNPQFDFNKAIIDKTHDLVAVYKPNAAFYEARGERGVKELRMTCNYITQNYPHIPIIIDAKRGDIGNTNKAYAEYVFDYLGADAITVMPYMGIGSLTAYFAYKEKGIIVGCLSSNPEAKEFQELIINDKPLYQLVLKEVINQHGDNPNTMIFVGATHPEQLAKIRKIAGEMTLLVPGIGAQGGSIKTVLKAGLTSKKAGMLINASRSIIFASRDKNFAEKAREEAKNLRDKINKER